VLKAPVNFNQPTIQPRGTVWIPIRYILFCLFDMPSMLWCCWLGGRKGIRPVRKLSGGVLACLSVWGKVQICIWPSWCHCYSLSLTIKWVLLFVLFLCHVRIVLVFVSVFMFVANVFTVLQNW